MWIGGLEKRKTQVCGGNLYEQHRVWGEGVGKLSTGGVRMEMGIRKGYWVGKI
jgi:hypothetical protein